MAMPTQEEKIFGLVLSQVRYEDAIEQTNLKHLEARDALEATKAEIRKLMDGKGQIAMVPADLTDRVVDAHRKEQFWRSESTRLCQKLQAIYNELGSTS